VLEVLLESGGVLGGGELEIEAVSADWIRVAGFFESFVNFLGTVV